MALSKRLQRFSLTDPWFLAGKAAAASGLALLGVDILGIDDRVSAAFVAVLCCSPAVSIGLRQGVGQLVGSLFGGTLGTFALAFGVPVHIGVPVAVGLAILATFFSGVHRAVAVAAFTALFVQIVPFGSPTETWLTRQAAVLVACVAGFVVNIVVSAAFYERVFRKRLQKVQAYIDDLLAEAHSTPVDVRAGFRVLEGLERELAMAQHELELRRASETAELLGRYRTWLSHRAELLHYVYTLGLRTDADEIAPATAAAWMTWLQNPTDEPPGAGPAMGTLPKRLAAAASRLEPIPT